VRENPAQETGNLPAFRTDARVEVNENPLPAIPRRLTAMHRCSAGEREFKILGVLGPEFKSSKKNSGDGEWGSKSDQ
jgi:hypothetical protein